MPLGDQRLGAFGKLTGKCVAAFDVNHGFVFSIDCMEMRPPVLAVENADDNSEKPAQFGHGPIICAEKAAEKFVRNTAPSRSRLGFGPLAYARGSDSNDAGFLVHTEDCPQAVADFPDGAVSADTFKKQGHEVLVPLGG